MNIDKQTLLSWIMTHNEQGKEKAANQWLPYLVNAHAAAVWELLLNQNNSSNDKEQIRKSWDLVQFKAVNRLFCFSNLHEIEEWCEYASYFLLSLKAVNASYRNWLSYNNTKGYNYFLWGKLFDKYLDQTSRKAEFTEALIKCYEKALEMFQNSRRAEPAAVLVTSLENSPNKSADQNENEFISKAIDTCKSALVKYNHEKMPETENNSGQEYNREKIIGSAEYIEEVLAACESLIERNPREKFPVAWAKNQSDLSAIYRERIRGDKAENLEKSIGACEAALLVLTKEKHTYDWAMAQHNLGVAFYRRIRGDKAENMEKAIAMLELALPERTGDKWADTKNILGNVYGKRIRGNKSDNIEKAIDAYTAATQEYIYRRLPFHAAMTQQNLGLLYTRIIQGNKAENMEKGKAALEFALQECKRDEHPLEWAMIQANLGNVYSVRVRGDKAENLEKAIGAFELALVEYTRHKLPDKCALIKHDLGIAYSRRIKGNKAENLEKAIVLFESGLLEYTNEKFPYNWAAIQNSLGAAYRKRIKGDKAQNLEKAIAAYEAALMERTFEKLPYEWAETQLNLGLVYTLRIKGDKSENIEKAIEATEATLVKFTREELPYNWAGAQMNLGSAYRKRIKGDKSENIEKAIAAYQSALLVRTPEQLPYDWAMAQNNLGVAYRDMVKGSKEKNLEKAITCFEAALLEFDREKLPYDWAMTQHNMGITYMDMLKGDMLENLEKAIVCFRKALEIYLPQTLPEDCSLTAFLLGASLYSIGRIKEAIVALKTAHQALEIIRNEVSASSSKERIASRYNNLYAIVVDCLLNHVNYFHQKDAGNEAFQYICASKGRSLAEKLGSQRPDINKLTKEDQLLAAKWNELESMWQQIEGIRAGLLELTTGNNQNDIDKNSLEESREKLLKKLNDLLAVRKNKLEDFSYQYPMLAATLTLPPLTASAAQQLAAGLHCTIIEFYHHESGWVAFIISGKQLKYISLPGAAHGAITDAVDFMKSYEAGLTAGYGSVMQKNIFQVLYKNLIAPLKKHLPVKGSLLIAPHDLMHYIPLSLAQDADEQFLFEQYELSFISGTTSAHALYQQILKEPPIVELNNEHLLMVVHSGQGRNKLNYTTTEAEAVVSVFKHRTLLLEEKATPKGVINSARQNTFSALHFSCHGGFDKESPELSGLMLHSMLTVEMILNEFRLKNHPLVVMSACKTGRSKVEGGDELTGLNQALLQSGAGVIVSSLWSVNDESTMHLMKTFYEERTKQGTPDTIALRKAMQRVRKMHEYKSAFFWGAFQVYGLPITHR